MYTQKYLRSCPYCGGPGRLEVSVSASGIKSFFVKCKTCRARGPNYTYGGNDDFDLSQLRNDAIAAWNRRTGDGEIWTGSRINYSLYGELTPERLADILKTFKEIKHAEAEEETI